MQNVTRSPRVRHARDCLIGRVLLSPAPIVQRARRRCPKPLVHSTRQHRPTAPERALTRCSRVRLLLPDGGRTFTPEVRSPRDDHAWGTRSCSLSWRYSARRRALGGCPRAMLGAWWRIAPARVGLPGARGSDRHAWCRTAPPRGRNAAWERLSPPGSCQAMVTERCRTVDGKQRPRRSRPWNAAPTGHERSATDSYLPRNPV